MPADAGRDRLADAEWLLTNGLGGYAMGTALGVPTRRYHGHLVASMAPPVQREVMLHSLVETLVLDPGSAHERSADLCCFRFRGGVQHPQGGDLLVRFEKTPTACRWVWRVEGVEVEKTLRLYHGQNAAAIDYHISGAQTLIRFQARPLLAMRDAHSLLHRGEAAGFVVEATQRHVRIRRGERALELACDVGWFNTDDQWWYGFEYDRERERGYDHHEDLASPGVFSVQVRPGEPAFLTLKAWLGQEPGRAADNEASRKQRLGEQTPRRGLATGIPEADARAISRLTAAADDFVARRGPADGEGLTVIAGYPWFSDWGRDTMISLPGLLLCTGRLEEAGRALRTFAASRRHGLIPNVFNEQTGVPEYNTVDASLWFIHSACEWARAAGGGLDAAIRDACLEIIAAYRSGTDFGIRCDTDGLITAGDASTQLTWMDAKRDGHAFTPRHGKAVEINALWIHGLRALAEVIRRDDPARGGELQNLAAKAAVSYVAKFWDPSRECCYDVLSPGAKDQWIPDRSIRPNQIFAASLVHSPLSLAQRRAVVRGVGSRLLTPAGLRTLDPADPGYKGRYAGTMWERDAAYHNGTVWPWLLGAYAEAVLRAGSFSDAARTAARAALTPLARAMEGDLLGQLPEIYDGDDEPGRPRRRSGCIAQAWSVAELLRGFCLVNTGAHPA
jgi:predicted glycogen debranching enzyme